MLGPHIGHQSSTFVLGPVFLMMGAPLLAGAGYVFGKLLALILHAFFPHRRAWLTKRYATMGIVAIAAAAALQAGLSLVAAEHSARPRVLFNSALIQKRGIDLPAGGVRPASRIYGFLERVDLAIPWRGDLVQLMYRENSVGVEFASSGRSLSIPLTGVDYVVAVDAIELEMGSSHRPALALLITGRATGQRDLLAVISESRELIYLELLDRFWNYSSIPLAIAPSPAGDLILVGSEPQSLLVFATQDGA